MTATDPDALEAEIEELKETTAWLSDLVTSLADNQQDILEMVDRLADDNRATEVAKEAVKLAMGLDEDEDLDLDLDMQPPEPDDRMFN